MAMGLYDPAFATLAGLYGRTARGPITGITLIAGFASTVGWPLSALLDAHFGWRGACLIWAGLHLLIGLPLNRLLIPRAPPPKKLAHAEGWPAAAPRGAMPLLAFVFAATWFVTGAMAAHLPHLLEIAGASATAAIAAAALVGPAQVGARLIEFGAMRRVHPLVSARLAAVLHPVGAAVLVAIGPAAIMAFSVLHGAGNGLLTIAKGTLPLAIFGPIAYGHRSGVLGAPARATHCITAAIRHPASTESKGLRTRHFRRLEPKCLDGAAVAQGTRRGGADPGRVDQPAWVFLGLETAETGISRGRPKFGGGPRWRRVTIHDHTRSITPPNATAWSDKRHSPVSQIISALSRFRRRPASSMLGAVRGRWHGFWRPSTETHRLSVLIFGRTTLPTRQNGPTRKAWATSSSDRGMSSACRLLTRLSTWCGRSTCSNGSRNRIWP